MQAYFHCFTNDSKLDGGWDRDVAGAEAITPGLKKNTFFFTRIFFLDWLAKVIWKKRGEK